MKLTNNINTNIFREYDVRGVYPTDLNEDVSYTFGKAYGTYIKKFNQTECIVGHDNRLSSDSLTKSLIEGILSTGIHVINIGLVTTPMYYYACILKNIPAGVMVTASHNPKDDNGFKFSFDERGNAKGEMIQEFLKFLLEFNFDDGSGMMTFYDVKDEYYKLLLSSVDIKHDRKLKVIIDCGNGTTSLFAPEIFNLIGVDLIVLYGVSDANFPNHHPDPAVEDNLKVLKDAVVTLKADVGIAFDGDGDRVGIIDENGKYIPADKFMIMVTRDLIPTSANKRILYDVKCSKALTDEINRLGGTPILCRTGNSYTKATTRDENCIFGGEFSGHVYFRDKFLGFDSGIYAGLRMVEMLSKQDKTVSQLLENIPVYYSTPEIKIASTDTKKKEVIDKIKEYCHENKFNTIELDGVRIELDDGWALVRFSNTGPNITARFEGKTEAIRDRLKDTFMNLIEMYNK